MLLVLGAVALVSLKPWAITSLVPNLSLSPAIGVALDDSVEVAPAQRLAVADAGIAAAPRATVAARPEPTPRSAPVPELGVSQAYPVSEPELISNPQPPPKPQSHPLPPAEPVVPPPAQPAPVAAPVPVPAPVLVANFENGLQGWSTSVLGDATPMIASGIVREGGKSSLVRLTGSQSSSQLTLGGDGGSSGAGAVQIHEGDEYAFAFSFYIQKMVYGQPGIDNLVMRLKSDASEASIFGLQLWDLPADEWESGMRGLWSSGDAVGGDRFLAPVPERAWHDVVVHFKASAQGEGFYEIYLDRELVDAHDGVSTIAPGSSYAQIEVGLFRDGDLLQGTSEIRLDAAKLGDTPESVLP